MLCFNSNFKSQITKKPTTSIKMAGKGRGGGKRQRGGGKRSALDRITNGSIRRLARRGGVKRISRAIYNDTR